MDGTHTFGQSHMLTRFLQFVTEAEKRGELINLMFENVIFQHVDLIGKVVQILEGAAIPYQLIGGMAVYIHVYKTNPDSARNTRDVDLMIDRADFQRVLNAIEGTEFSQRHAAKVDMSLHREDQENAIHLNFAGESLSSSQIESNPPLNPVRENIHGIDLWIVSVSDLVRMKLAVSRLKDWVHI